MASLPILTVKDLEIMERAKTDARFFTSYYIRTPDQPAGWAFDHNIDPPWQLALHHAKQTDITVVGGFGSGKTLTVAVSYLVYAAITPDYKFLNVAPTAWQSKQMYDTLLTWLEGTIFQQKFMGHRKASVEKPFPKITLHYRIPDIKLPDGKIVPGRTVKSTMEFMSTSDDGQRIKTWEGDAINIDQGEQVTNLTESIISLGTRLRGTIRGRPRQGRLSITANSEANPELWYVFDLAKDYPDTNRSFQISTYSNKNLTESQIASFRRRIKDSDKLEQHLGGERPTGGGIEFSKAMVAACDDLSLDTAMETNLALGNPEFRLDRTREADVVLWEMPYDRTRTHVVFGDPGQGTAPARNAPVVCVVDMTDYPKGPAVLKAFWWGNGGGKYAPWIDKMLEWRSKYHAVNTAYDATGGQKVHSEITFAGMDDIVPVDMGGQGTKKRAFIQTLKLTMLKGRLKWPTKIKGLQWQFLKYELPDDKLNQDIVAAFLVWAGYLWYVGFETEDDVEAKAHEAKPAANARYKRNYNRNSGRGRHRNR